LNIGAPRILEPLKQQNIEFSTTFEFVLCSSQDSEDFEEYLSENINA